jgi:hypothetical protein
MASTSDGKSVDVTALVQWSTANPEVAAVEPNGVVTGKSKGNTILTATYSGFTATRTIVVPAVLHDTLNAPGENLSGIGAVLSLHSISDQMALDDFVSPYTTTVDTVTFQGIRCGAPPTVMWFLVMASNGDVPDFSRQTGGFYQNPDALVYGVEGFAPRFCPDGRDGILVNYRISQLKFNVTAGERYWIGVEAVISTGNLGGSDSWWFRYGRADNKDALLFQRPDNVFARQPGDLAFKVE